MLQKEIIRTVVMDQQTELELRSGTVKRELLEKIPPNQTSATIIKGVRRCGKSTLLRMLMEERFAKKIFYLNFDDERLMDFSSQDFQSLMEIFIELFGTRSIVLFDEIQNVVGWELFINRLLRQDYQVFLTGSNADLLSKELGTHLTGRHLDYELYPFSFEEYLSIKNLVRHMVNRAGGFSTVDTAAIFSAFKAYLTHGGMPEAVIMQDQAVVGQIIEDIIQKDIIRRYNIRKQNELRSVLRFLISNASRLITFKSIADNFAVKSPNTIQKYIRYAEETYLIFTINRYEKKIKKFDKNPKKVYCVDNGMVLRYSSATGPPTGALLENLVAVELMRRGQRVYYYSNRNGTETDFVIINEGKQMISQAIQVCLNPLEHETMKREESAILQTMKENSLTDGLILTLEYEEEKQEQNGKIIRYLPVWKWLLRKKLDSKH